METISDHDQKRFWSKVALPNKDGFMLWLDAPNGQGYGRIGLGAKGQGSKGKQNGKYTKAHRVSLWLAAGPPPEGEDQTAHSCREKLCVAPLHLRWASAAGNYADRLRDGTDQRGERNRRAILTAGQVSELRGKYASGGVRQIDLATEYGIKQSTVSMIVLGKSWKEDSE